MGYRSLLLSIACSLALLCGVNAQTIGPSQTSTSGAITPTTVNGNTITTGTGTLTLGSATLNAGAGGTLESNAFTSTAYAPLASPTFTGTVTIPTPFTIGAVSMTTTGTKLNFLSAAAGTTGTTSTNIVFSTSPTLVTPVLGVATATSLALGGATIGTNTLAAANPSAAQATFSGWNTTAGISTINGEIHIGSDATFQGVIQEGNGILYIDNTYDNAAGNISIRTRTAGTPINAITVNGTGEVTIGSTIDSSSTATGSLQVQGGAVVKKRFWIPAITASAGLQTAVLCQSSGGEMIADSVACLASSARFKNIAGTMEDGALAKLAALPMRRWSYKPEGIFHNDVEHVGPIAEDVAAMDRRLAGYDVDGNVRTYSTEQLLAFTIKAVQELKADNDNLRSQIGRLQAAR